MSSAPTMRHGSSNKSAAADLFGAGRCNSPRQAFGAKALDEHGANKDVRRRFPTQRSGRRWTIPAGRHFSPGPRHLGGHGTRGHDERNSNDELWRQFHKSAAADWVPAGHHFSPTQGNRGGMGEHHPNDSKRRGFLRRSGRPGSAVGRWLLIRRVAGGPAGRARARSLR
jgi:hypothetical protein